MLKNSIESSVPRPCLHSRKIYYFLDIKESSKHRDQFTKHINQCSYCSEKLESYQKFLFKINKHIPEVKMDRDMKLNVSCEVNELIKQFSFENAGNIFDKLKTIVSHVFSTYNKY